MTDLIQRPLPISAQVEDLLRKRILQDEYSAGERMPSEARLAEELGVSRATVRSALAVLAAEGLVERRHGDGTYPTPRVFEMAVRAQGAWDIEHQVRRLGRTPSNKVLASGLRPASPEERDGLHLERGKPVFAVRRLFLADRSPVMLADHVLNPADLATDIPSQAVELPMLQFLSRYSRRALHAGEVHFQALQAAPEIAERLETPPGSPLLLLQAHLYDDRGSPVLLGWEYYRGDQGFYLPIRTLET